LRRSLAVFVAFAVCAAVGCEKVPLLAPTQSTVTLQINTTTVPINGSAEVLATVTEQAGTPVQNGTSVTFTASFGTMDPAEARTENGIARSTFRAGVQSGTAKVGAFSGAARATEVDVLVGGAAAQAVAVRLEPSSVPQTGGTVNVIAVVTDASGNRLPGAPVVFSADNGVLGSNSGATDQNGESRTTLTTNRQSVVKATVAGKEGQATVSVVNLPTVGISLTTTNPIVGLPVVFSVTPGSTQGGNPVQNVVVDFGDGTPPVALGAITSATAVSHVYDRANTYTVTATINDTGGFQSTSSTIATVLRAVVNVSVTASSSTGTVGTPVTFTVTVTNASNLPISGVVLSFGDGTATNLGPTGGTASKTYITPGTYVVTATAADTRGDTYRGQTQILIVASAALSVSLDAVSGDPAVTINCPGTVYPKTCTTSLLGAGVRAIFTAGCNTGFGAGACANAIQYVWNFGDGTTEITTSPSTDHVFRARGDYVIVVQVITNTGSQGAQRLTLIIQ
jgi:Big-like domain-containing protein/PKD domain-containing protein